MENARQQSKYKSIAGCRVQTIRGTVENVTGILQLHLVRIMTLGTEPSSFARLRRADSEMKYVKNMDCFDMFLRSAVAPDPQVNLTNPFLRTVDSLEPMAIH